VLRALPLTTADQLPRPLQKLRRHLLPDTPGGRRSTLRVGLDDGAGWPGVESGLATSTAQPLAGLEAPPLAEPARGGDGILVATGDDRAEPPLGGIGGHDVVRPLGPKVLINERQEVREKKQLPPHGWPEGGAPPVVRTHESIDGREDRKALASQESNESGVAEEPLNLTPIGAIAADDLEKAEPQPPGPLTRRT
jgi:hypothetical protein